MTGDPVGGPPPADGGAPSPTAAPPPRRPAASSTGRGLRIGRVRGAPVFLSPVTLVFAAIVASSFATLDRDRLPFLSDGRVYLLAGATAVGFILSLLLHEIGHALVALGFGLRVRSVTVYGFAGATEIEPEPQTPWREFLVAFVGPGVNGVIALACWLAYMAVHADSEPGVLLFDLFFVNIWLFLFNLAPGLPLDGGRLVVAGVWGVTKDRLAGVRAGAYAGFVVAALVALAGLVWFQSFGVIWTVAVAAFLALGAQQHLRSAQVRQRLPGLSAGALARRTLPVDESLPLAEALRRAQEAGATAVVVVDRDGTPTMVMTGAAVDALPVARRPWVPVTSVSRKIVPGMTLDASLSGQDLIDAMERLPASEYVVVDGSQPVGVLAQVDVVARIDPGTAAKMGAARR